MPAVEAANVLTADSMQIHFGNYGRPSRLPAGALTNTAP
jgi:hypothetical protein